MLPVIVMSVFSMIAVLSVCTAVLDLNDVARILARAAATADDPSTAVEELGARLGVGASTQIDADTDIITVTATRAARVWFLGGRLPPVTIRSASSILREPQVVLGR